MAALLCGLLVVRVFYLRVGTPYGLAPDEAQYWTWLAHDDWSFVTKPPLTTWLMGVSTAWLGDTLVGVKLFALLGQVAVVGLGVALARALVPAPERRAVGWWAFALLATVPMVAVGGLLMSPDALLLPLWMAALLVVVRALEVDDARALCWPRWLLLGVLVGLAGLAKYTAALFFPLLGLLLLWQRPRWLLAPQVWSAGALALLLQAPVLYWNMTHGWAGLHHVLWQADSGDSRHGGLGTLGDFLGGQALVLGPVVLIFMVMAWGRCLNFAASLPPRVAALTVFTLPIFAGFCAMTLTGKVQPNWPLLATVPALVLVAAFMPRLRRATWPRVLMAGVLLNALLTVLMYNTHVLRGPVAQAVGISLPLKIDPTKDLMGWADMGELFGVALQRFDRPVVLSWRYQTLAQLQFHTRPRADFMYWNAEGRRAVDYDDWPWPADLASRPVVAVSEQPAFTPRLAELFNECRPWHSFGAEQQGVVVRRLYTWVCWGLKGGR